MTDYKSPFNAEDESQDKTLVLLQTSHDSITMALSMNQPLALNGSLMILKNNQGSGGYFRFMLTSSGAETCTARELNDLHSIAGAV